MFLYLFYGWPRIIIHCKNAANEIAKLIADVDPLAEVIVHHFDALNGFLKRSCFERTHPVLHPKQNDSEGPDIGWIAMPEAAGNLWRQEVRCTAGLAFELLVGLQLAGKPKVTYLDLITGSKEAVTQLQTTVSYSRYSLWRIFLLCRYLTAWRICSPKCRMSSSGADWYFLHFSSRVYIAKWSYPICAVLQENVFVLLIFKRVLKEHDVGVRECLMNLDFVDELRNPIRTFSCSSDFRLFFGIIFIAYTLSVPTGRTFQHFEKLPEPISASSW